MEDLFKKRASYNAEADKYKADRDVLNMQTKQWAEKRDKLNGAVRALVDKANVHRQERDTYNEKVKQAKVDRDVWNKKVSELNEELIALKKEHAPSDGINIGQMRKKMKNLEFQQMTSVLSPDKEKALVDELKKIKATIEEYNRKVEENEDIRDLVLKVKEAKDEAEKHHASVGEYAAKAQEEHDRMMEIYVQSDALRKEADEAQAEFIKVKTAADEKHKLHIEMIVKVHEIDDTIDEIREKDRETKEGKDSAVTKQKAEEIYEKFKKGEKLSTEDLLTLQKSGYL